MFKITTLLTLVALLASLQAAFAVPFFTNPIASTSATGGQKLRIKWKDNDKAPAYSAKAWGNSTVYLAAGSQNTQFKLQTLASNVSPSRHSGSYTVDKSIGPSGKYYFIRMEGSEKDSAGNPVMAFSARFTLQGMSGKFNSTVLQAAMGQEGSASSTSGMTSSKTSSSLSSLSSPTALAAASPSNSSSTSDAGRLTSNNAFTLAGAGALAAAGLVALL